MKIYPSYNLTYILFALFTLGGFIPKAYTHSPESNQLIHKPKKIYISPEQLIITKEGIYAYVQDDKEPILVKTVSHDKKGLYFKPAPPQYGPCGLHNLWCIHCGGCGVLYCPMVCCCPFGGGG